MSIAEAIAIEPSVVSAEQAQARRQIRAFLDGVAIQLSPLDKAKGWIGTSPAFSAMLGEAGWIGMTWPKKYGGAERSALERLAVLEELLAAGVPVSAHWAAERQCGPLLMRYGTPEMCATILPGIVSGKVYFCIGMSEPNTGSDLASVRTRADKVDGGWRINGTKLWTSNADIAHFMVALVRTTQGLASKYEGLSQVLIDMRSEGLSVRQVVNMVKNESFSEVTFSDVFVPDDHLLGAEGKGWEQVTTELTLERGGPERFMSSMALLTAMIDRADHNERQHCMEIGRLIAELSNLRDMSRGIATMLSKGRDPYLATSTVKDLGALHEQKTPEVAHELFGAELRTDGSPYTQTHAFITQIAPSFSLRGGTREVLRGIIAKGLGLR